MISGLPRTEGPQPINLTMNEHTPGLGLGSHSTADWGVKKEAAVPAGQTARPNLQLIVCSEPHSHTQHSLET